MVGRMNNAVDHYRKASVNTASPIELIIMLYDGAVRFLDEGKAAMLNKQYETQNTTLQKAQRIITELMTSLDMIKGGEIATNLFNLYNYMLGRIAHANIYDKPEMLDEVKNKLIELRDAWLTVQEETTTDMAPKRPADGSKIRLEG